MYIQFLYIFTYVYSYSHHFRQINIPQFIIILFKGEECFSDFAKRKRKGVKTEDIAVFSYRINLI